MHESKQKTKGAGKNSREFDWFDRPSSQRLLRRLVWGACAATLIADLFVHRHSYFGVDGWFGAYAMIGLLGCSAMILFAKGPFALLVKRDENYYAEEGDEDVIPDDIDNDHVH